MRDQTQQETFRIINQRYFFLKVPDSSRVKTDEGKVEHFQNLIKTKKRYWQGSVFENPTGPKGQMFCMDTCTAS